MSVVTQPTRESPLPERRVEHEHPHERGGAERTEALDPTYRDAILRAERRPENAPGADKSWVARMDDAFRRHYARARRG
jgi:hypothetical protein